MSLERIFPILNEMEADGVIGRYAIGGAVGAIFWLEPFQTKDLDVFVVLPAAPGGTLLTLDPIYEYLHGRGCRPEGQFIVMEGWSVEFIPPATPLVEEALAAAVWRDANGVATRVSRRNISRPFVSRSDAPEITIASSALSRLACSIGKSSR